MVFRLVPPTRASGQANRSDEMSPADMRNPDRADRWSEMRPKRFVEGTLGGTRIDQKLDNLPADVDGHEQQTPVGSDLEFLQRSRCGVRLERHNPPLHADHSEDQGNAGDCYN